LLSDAFEWDRAPEGFDYWKSIHDEEYREEQAIIMPGRRVWIVQCAEGGEIILQMAQIIARLSIAKIDADGMTSFNEFDVQTLDLKMYRLPESQVFHAIEGAWGFIAAKGSCEEMKQGVAI
jgi:hypothetical protein